MTTPNRLFNKNGKLSIVNNCCITGTSVFNKMKSTHTVRCNVHKLTQKARIQ